MPLESFFRCTSKYTIKYLIAKEFGTLEYNIEITELPEATIMIVIDDDAVLSQDVHKLLKRYIPIGIRVLIVAGGYKR